MTVNRTTIALTQGLQAPLEGPEAGSLVRPAARHLVLLVALAVILAMVAF
jgi:hypothetical protein